MDAVRLKCVALSSPFVMQRFVARPLTSLLSIQKRKASAVAREPTRRLTELEESHTHHAAGGEPLWTRISIFVVIPALIGTAVYVYGRETEHMHHIEEHPPQFVAYPHLRIRKSQFPWGDGDKSLFHNDVMNPSPDS